MTGYKKAATAWRADRRMRQARGGDGGFIQRFKATLERGLQGERTSDVGFEKGDSEASAFAHSRNDTTPKTVATETGEVYLAIPRDREGSFTPQLVPKGPAGFRGWTSYSQPLRGRGDGAPH